MQRLIDGFVWAAAQKDRRPDLAAFELAFVVELRSGQSECCNCDGSLFGWREGCCRARFVMILDKANQLVLVVHVGAEVQAHVFGRVVFEPIVELLVVAEIEAELLQLPLKIPIGLGDKKKSSVARL